MVKKLNIDIRCDISKKVRKKKTGANFERKRTEARKMTIAAEDKLMLIERKAGKMNIVPA